MNDITVIYLILGGLLLLAHLYVFIRGWREKRKAGEVSENTRIWVFPLIGLDALPSGFVVLILFIFEVQIRWYMAVLYVLAWLLVIGLLLALLSQWFNWKRFLAWLLCAALVFGAIFGVERYKDYLDSITLGEYFNYRTYDPFREDSLVQTLDEPASLRFSEEDALPRMDGATALYPVYAAFCQAVYPESMADWESTDYRDVIACGTTAWAYKDIVNGERDIIFVAGPSKEQEEYAAENGVELVYTPIGREAFVFFVHPDNPIESLTLEQLRGIYSGEITSWDQLGVYGLGDILAYQRDEGSGSQTALERFVMRDTPLMPAKKETVVTGMGDIVDKVSLYKNHRNAIGFSFRFYCTALMKGFDIKLVAIEGVAPTVENIENGAYPLASSFYAVTRSDADENTRALLAWICGEQGQTLVEKTGYTRNAA